MAVAAVVRQSIINSLSRCVAPFAITQLMRLYEHNIVHEVVQIHLGRPVPFLFCVSFFFLSAQTYPQIPLTCGPHILTFSTQQVHLPSRFLIVCKIPYPYGIYRTPHFVASTSAPELCQPHQTDTCAHPTRFVPSGTTSRRGALYTSRYLLDFELFCLFVRFSTSCRARSPGKSGRGPCLLYTSDAADE